MDGLPTQTQTPATTDLASPVDFEAPDPAQRAARLKTVAAMIYLIFNEGYGAAGGQAHLRAPLRPAPCQRRRKRRATASSGPG